MGYTPEPVDLTGIELDQVMQEDIETIVRNIHETWGKQRELQGWKYGEVYGL